MKRINWVNVIELVILAICTVMIMHDVYMLMFKSYSFTWFGLITFMAALIQGAIVYENLEDKIKIALNK